MGAVWVKKKDLDKFCQCLSVLTRITNCIKKNALLIDYPSGSSRTFVRDIFVCD